MKLVQLLAKELKEWPKGATFIVQDENKDVWSLDKGIDLSYAVNEWVSEEWFNLVQVDGCEILIDSLAHDNKTSKVTREQWHAEREKMNKPKWIRHRGGNSTLHPGTMVEARLRSGEIQRAIAGAFLWDNSLSDHAVNIMAYRIIEETKDQEIEEVTPKHMAFGYASKEEMVAQIGEECPFAQVASTAEKTNFGTITYKLEIDATEATKDIDSLVAKWGQIESPLKWRDEIIELEAYEEEFRREREKLIRKLESEGFKLIDHMAPVYVFSDVDFSDWRNWQVGDVFVTDGRCQCYTKGKEYVVESLVDNDAPIKAIDDYGDVFCLHMSEVKFIRRP